MKLTFKGTHTRKKFSDGRRKMLLVDFLGPNNESVGDWCPKWAEVQEIVLAAVDTEQENDGKWVEFVTKIEKKLSTRMPERAVKRQEAFILEYTPSRPPHITMEYLDGNQRGWRATPTLTLGCPIPQGILDILVENRIEVVAIVREDTVVDVRVEPWEGYGGHNPANERSALSLREGQVSAEGVPGGGFRLVLRSEIDL